MMVLKSYICKVNFSSCQPYWYGSTHANSATNQFVLHNNNQLYGDTQKLGERFSPLAPPIVYTLMLAVGRSTFCHILMQ